MVCPRGAAVPRHVDLFFPCYNSCSKIAPFPDSIFPNQLINPVQLFSNPAVLLQRWTSNDASGGTISIQIKQMDSTKVRWKAFSHTSGLLHFLPLSLSTCSHRCKVRPAAMETSRALCAAEKLGMLQFFCSTNLKGTK